MSIHSNNNARKKTGLAHFYYSFTYSMFGFYTAFKNEAAFRQELFFVVLGIVIAFMLPVTTVEKVLLVGALFIIIITELLNSAIEAVVDRISDEIHPLSKAAKDLGSAAVFTAILLCILTWGIVLWHYFFN